MAGTGTGLLGHSTLVLIGDPKQAIYAFRGGDIETYLRAAATAGDKQTLGTNWRSDAALVDRLQVVLRGRSSAARTSWFTTCRHTIRGIGWRALPTTIRFGYEWCREIETVSR